MSQWDSGAHEFESQRARSLPRQLRGDGVGADGRLPIAQLPGGIASGPSQSFVDQFDDPFRKAMLYTLQRKGNFIQFFGQVGTTPVLVRAAEARTYVLIQNTSAASQLIIAFGYPPSVTGTNITGLILAANGGNYEPAVIPQQDIWLLGSGAGVGYVVCVAQG